jgi:hypothetical protein
VAAAPEPEPEREEDRSFFTLGAFYGYNLQDDADDSREGSSHLGGLNLSYTYAVTDWMGLGLEQAGFYNWGTEDDGFGGRTAAGLNFGILDWDVIPYVGANIGYIYGSGIEDDFFAGPEIGIAVGWFNAKVAYDMPFGRAADGGSSRRRSGWASISELKSAPPCRPFERTPDERFANIDCLWRKPL